MTDVFISYKRKHRARIEKIAGALRAEGLDVWYDAHLESGTSFSQEIDTRTQSAKAVLTCWTEDARGSKWVLGESTVGLERDVLVSIQLEPCRLPPPFNMIHAEDLSDWDGDTSHPGWKKIVVRLLALNSREKLKTPAPDIASKPEKDKVTDPLESKQDKLKEQEKAQKIKREQQSRLSEITKGPFRIVTYSMFIVPVIIAIWIVFTGMYPIDWSEKYGWFFDGLLAGFGQGLFAMWIVTVVSILVSFILSALVFFPSVRQEYNFELTIEEYLQAMEYRIDSSFSSVDEYEGLMFKILSKIVVPIMALHLFGILLDAFRSGFFVG